MPKIAILVSGGLESASLLAWALKRREDVYPIYVQSGHIWEKVERNHLLQLLKAMKTQRLRPLVSLSIPATDIQNNIWSVTGKKVPGARSKDEAVYLPGKNILLIGKVGVYCTQNKIQEIALGVLKTNPFPDASSRFFRLYENALSIGLGCRIRIRTPFLLKTKKEVLKISRTLPLRLTFSCIHPIKNQHCGRCNKCAERRKAFKLTGIEDKTLYADRRRTSKTTVSK